MQVDGLAILTRPEPLTARIGPASAADAEPPTRFLRQTFRQPIFLVGLLLDSDIA